MKKKISIILIISIFLNLITPYQFDSYATVQYTTFQQLVIGYFDVWCRSDGTTWLKYKNAKGQRQTAKPGGPTITDIAFPIATQPMYEVKGIEYFTGNISEDEFNRIKYKNINSLADFREQYAKYSVPQGNLQVNKNKAIGKSDGIQLYLDKLNLPKLNELMPDDNKENKPLSQNVEGWRYYIPILVTFELEEQYKQGDITVDFRNEREVFEGQDIGFEDLTTVWSNPIGCNEMDKEELIIEGINGTSYKKTIPRSAYEIINKQNPIIRLMVGEYKLTLKGWDTMGHSKTAYGSVKVKKAEQEQKQLVGILKSQPIGEIGVPFKVTSEESFTNDGMIKERENFVSIGNPDNFQRISIDKGGADETFNFIGTEETVYYFKTKLITTTGLVGWTNITATSLKDNTAANADAVIDTKFTWYEGIFELVRNDSSIEIQGARKEELNGTWSVSSDIGRRYSSNQWKMYDLAKNPKEQVYPEKKDWKSYDGGSIRYNVPGDKEFWLRVSGKGGSKDIDTKSIEVLSLPRPILEVTKTKKNRETILNNRSWFKPEDAWQNGENGKLNDKLTKIIIEREKTGQVATSVGGQPINESWVKGLTMEFGEVDEGKYTHEKNDIMRLVFVGNEEEDQTTEQYKITLEITDNRGNTKPITKIITILGDVKPISRIDGIWDYLRNPFKRTAQTELYETSYSKDNDDITVRTREAGTNKDISAIGVNKKIPYEPDKVGEIKIKNKAKDNFINEVYEGLRKFLNSDDELEDEKEYKLSIENVAPSASLEGIKSENINLINFIDTDNDISSQINNMTQDIFSETKTKVVNTNFVYREDKGIPTSNSITDAELTTLIDNNSECKQLKEKGYSLELSNENGLYKYFYLWGDINTKTEGSRYWNYDVTENATFVFFRYNKVLDKIEKISQNNIEFYSYHQQSSGRSSDPRPYQEFKTKKVFILKDRYVILAVKEHGRKDSRLRPYSDRTFYINSKAYYFNNNKVLDYTSELSGSDLEGNQINIDEVKSSMDSVAVRYYVDIDDASGNKGAFSYDAKTNRATMYKDYDEYRYTISPYLVSHLQFKRDGLDYTWINNISNGTLLFEKGREEVRALGDREEWKYFVQTEYQYYNGGREYSNRYTFDINNTNNNNLNNWIEIGQNNICGFEDNLIYVKKAINPNFYPIQYNYYYWYPKQDVNMNNLIPLPNGNEAPKFIDYTYKLNQEVNNFNKAKHNYLTILVNKDIMFGHLETLKMQERINAFNTEYNLTGNEALKPLIVDIGGKNEESFKELINSTNGLYFKANSNLDGIDKVKEHLKTITGGNRAKNTIKINQGDILELQGHSIDYESDPIVLEQYRLRGQSWGSFGNSIAKLQGNNFQFNEQGNFVLEYQSKDNPPSIDDKDYGKFSNIATLIVQVGDGDLPEPPKIPPTIDVKILSADGEYRGKERRRLDFVIMAHEGTNPINWGSLKVDFDKMDYLPSKAENNFTNKKAFSRIFTQLEQHKIIVELSDIEGLPNRVEIPFEITKDLGTSGNFDIVGDGNRNQDTGLAQFFIDNESASSLDNDEFEITYFEEVPKYVIQDEKLTQNGLGWGELDVVGKMFETDNKVKVKQRVEEFYSNGTGLNEEELDKDGYRIFKFNETIKEKPVTKEPPTLEYKVSPKIVIRGEGITHFSKISDDTNKPKIQEFKFTHDPSIFQNNKGVNPFNNIVTKEGLNQTDYKGLYHFYSKVEDEDGMSSNWVDGGVVKVVSKPVADFEPYTADLNSDGNNKEYAKDVFGKGSQIEIENKAYNEDYGTSRMDHGIESIKMEYRNLEDGDFIEFYNHRSIIFYPSKFNLPNEVSQENGIYEIKQTIVSVDGIEAEYINKIIVLDFRLDATLEPSKIYPGQTYKIKAKLSKDSIDAVAYVQHLNNYVTLNKVSEDENNAYYELPISTSQTMKDGNYNITVYGLYPYNLQREQKLTLQVKTSIEMASDVIPLGPTEYNSTLEHNSPDNDLIKVAASENVRIEATVTCPIPLMQVEAWLDGEGSTLLWYNPTGKKWEGMISVRDTKVDKNYYNLKLRATAVNGSYSENGHRTWVHTPINLNPIMPANVCTDSNINIKANTSKYADTVKVTLFRNTPYENTFYLNGKANGEYKDWIKNYKVSDKIPEGNYVARFVGTTPNGNREVKDVNFRVDTLKISGYLAPNPAMAGDMIHFYITTEGYADKIEIEVDPDIMAKDKRVEMGYEAESYPLEFNVDGTKYMKTDELKYIAWCTTDKTLDKNGNRLRPEYKFIVRAWRGSTSQEIELKLDIQGDIRQLIKVGIGGKQ